MKKQIVSRIPMPNITSICASSLEEAMRKTPWATVAVETDIGWMLFESAEDCEKWKSKKEEL